METTTTAVQDLINKAAKAETADDALRYSQAAVNVANALAKVRETETY